MSESNATSSTSLQNIDLSVLVINRRGTEIGKDPMQQIMLTGVKRRIIHGLIQRVIVGPIASNLGLTDFEYAF